MALQAQCRVSKKSPEKRQRVLLSNKYTEAVQDIDKKLADISQSLKSIASRQDNVQPCLQRTGGTSQLSTSNTILRTAPHDIDLELGGFRGESSFEAHVRRMKDHLRKTCDIGDLINEQHGVQNEADVLATYAITSSSSTDHFADINMSTEDVGRSKTRPFDRQNLQSTDLTLKILNLTQIEKQRFFVDIPVIDEDEFATFCKEAYFATGPCSLAAQAIVTVGMYYLVHDLDMKHYGDMELTVALVDSHLHHLRGNAFRVCQELRLCMESSFESCQALSLLGMFYLKDGRIETAWRLLSSAARMCLDLGMNCKQQADHKSQTKCERLLWWVYAINQPLALTLGRTPTIRRGDINSDCPELVWNHDVVSFP